VSRDSERDQEGAEDETKPEAARTDHPTGEDQAVANTEDEPAG
jgi:hypothetical protein